MSKPKPPTNPPSPSQFSHEVTKIAVAQTLKSIGFKSSKSSALETLTRITTLFLHSLSKTASSHANFSCRRTQCNLFDVVHAIEESSLPFGFPGAADVTQTLLRSKTLVDLDSFFDSIDEFPLLWNRRLRNFLPPSSVVFSGKINDNNNGNRGSEIPRWLPEFPECGNRKLDDVDVVAEGNVKERKGLWEDRRLECGPIAAEKAVKGKKEAVLKGRRERVKFKLAGKRKSLNVGGLDDLALRNGVCRGGKRVCLVKKGDSCCSFFHDDDDDDKLRSNVL